MPIDDELVEGPETVVVQLGMLFPCGTLGETNVVIDRDTASRLGLIVSQIDNTLYDAFGQRQVSTIYSAVNQYHVVMVVDPRDWQDPAILKDLYVSTAGANPRGTAVTNAVAGTVARRPPLPGPGSSGTNISFTNTFGDIKLASINVGAANTVTLSTTGGIPGTGNIVNASPAADGVPALMAYDAEIELASKSGRRRIPLSTELCGVHVPLPGEVFNGVRRVVQEAGTGVAARFCSDGRLGKSAGAGGESGYRRSESG